MSRLHRTLLLSLLIVGAGATLWAAAAGRAPEVRPMEPPGPHEIQKPSVTPGRWLRSQHHGAPHPARAAITVGTETWVGTASAGLLRYDRRLWTDPAHARPNLKIDVQQGLPSSVVNDLLSTANGDLLVATDRGLARLDRRGRLRQVLLRDRVVTSLSPGLAGTRHGLFALHSVRGGDLVPSPLAGIGDVAIAHLHRCGDWLYIAASSTLAVHISGWIEHVALPEPVSLAGCNRSGTVIAATLDGLYRVQGRTARPIPAWTRHATAVTRATDGSVLFGTFGDGVFRHIPGQDRLQRLMARGQVSLIHAPTPDLVLTGTQRGLFVRPSGGSSVRVPLDGPPPGVVTALALRDGALWVGTFDAGIGVRSRSGAWSRVAVRDSRITTLRSGPGSRMWIGTASGLVRERTQGGGGRLCAVRDPKGWLSRHISTLRRRGRRLWVGAHPGLVAIDVDADGELGFEYVGASGQEADAGLVGPTVNGVAFTSRGIWAGTEDGLALLAGREAWALTDLQDLLPDNWITDVRGGPPGTVYVLTLRSGLLEIGSRGSRLLRTKLMTSPSGMLALGNRVLFGTNRQGLALVLDSKRIHTFGPGQGLASSAVAALAYDPTTDRLWVGGNAGVDVLDRAVLFKRKDRQ